jgi:hypothetical protein
MPARPLKTGLFLVRSGLLLVVSLLKPCYRLHRARACAMVVEENWNKFSFCLATPPCKQRNGGGTLDGNPPHACLG